MSKILNIGIKVQEKTITPSTEEQVITADEGYIGLDKVNVNAVTSAIDSNIKPENIKKDVSILGVLGTLEGGGSALDIETGKISGVHNAQYITISGLKARPRAVSLVKTANAYSSNSQIDAITYVRGAYNYILTCRRSSSLQYTTMSTKYFYTSYDSMDSVTLDYNSVAMAYENGNLYIKRRNETVSTYGYSSEYDYVIMY